MAELGRLFYAIARALAAHCVFALAQEPAVGPYLRNESRAYDLDKEIDGRRQVGRSERAGSGVASRERGFCEPGAAQVVCLAVVAGDGAAGPRGTFSAVVTRESGGIAGAETVALRLRPEGYPVSGGDDMFA